MIRLEWLELQRREAWGKMQQVVRTFQRTQVRSMFVYLQTHPSWDLLSLAVQHWQYCKCIILYIRS
jgi:hypothetical protein